jgi:hypothetical protein
MKVKSVFINWKKTGELKENLIGESYEGEVVRSQGATASLMAFVSSFDKGSMKLGDHFLIASFTASLIVFVDSCADAPPARGAKRLREKNEIKTIPEKSRRKF